MLTISPRFMYAKREGDPDGEALADALVADGFTFTSSKPRQALINFFADNRADGINSTVLPEFVLPLMEAATPNRRNWVSRTQGTYQTGNGTHGTDRITLTADAYNYGRTLAQLGMSAPANGLFFIYPATVSLGVGVDTGVSDGGLLELTPRYSNAGSKGYFRMGTSGAAGAIEGTDTTAYSSRGVWAMSRYSTSSGVIKFYDWTTITTVTSSSGFSGTTFPVTSRSLVAGGQNISGTIQNATSRAYSGYGAFAGITPAQIDLFFINLKTFLTAWGII